jgi:hypothetical protein
MVAACNSSPDWFCWHVTYNLTKEKSLAHERHQSDKRLPCGLCGPATD